MVAESNAASAELADHIPLSPRVFHILLALAEEPRNGYQIAAAVPENSRGRIRLSTGTLYEALHRMTRKGLVQPVPKGADLEVDGRKQRFYTPTALGLRVLRAEAERLSGDAELARSTLSNAP